MAEPAFVHLHVHSHYSMLDGACRITDLVRRTKELGMDAVAISDHGCLFGVVEFYNECRSAGIRPIIGMEAYMAPGDRRERSTPGGNAGEAAYHLLLLAENLEGYRNLVKLSSIAYREGFYYKPRIDKEVLREYRKGLIATSACLGGEVASAFMKRDARHAKQIAETYLEIFGPDRFYIEVQKHIPEQDAVNPELAELAKKLGVGLVGTNDVHFLNEEDHFAHDCLCCISMGRQVSEEGRMKYPTELYLKSPREMAAAVGAFDQAMENTVRIARMCDVELDFSKRYAPVYRVPENKRGTGFQPVQHGLKAHATIPDDERYLRQLCEEGLEWRYGTREVGSEVRARLEKELGVITNKQFASYFLINWDFCNYARDNGIPVGARGSGVGTMVGYLLGLCNVDPLKYGLLFERFMDPSRDEMPDIDIDICQDGRQKVIDYVRNKYGHVAQIITFGTLAARAACKDVGRVLGVPLAEVDKLTKLIPGTPGMTLDKALAQSPDLKQLYDTNPTIKQVIDIGKRLEGLCRNAGCHAAGVIIADQPLDDLVPLYRDSDGNILTQFEGPIAEKCGLLKMDFLGLRTLSVLTRSVDLEKQTRPARGITDEEMRKQGIPLDDRNRIDIEAVALADQKVLDLFRRGETRGIFQFESGGMQDLLMKMQPDRIEDLIAANALYRPGPMELIPLYCNRKHGREPVPSVHPIMDEILKETYGIMVYQEQVMQIFNQLGGIELANAYKLIKAISKKTTDVIAKFQPHFIEGCVGKGIDRAKAQEIFELILKFGGYGFNKSHSTRYAIIAFQTAYMKAYHPVEYMAALLTYEMGSTDKVVEYIEECRQVTLPDGSRGIEVRPPDVNVSGRDFTPVYVGVSDEATKRRSDGGKGKPPLPPPSSLPIGTIRFGLCAIRGVGEKAVESIIEERSKTGAFAGLHDFCERLDSRQVNRATIEALVKCGAFASTGARRAPLLHVLDAAIETGQQAQQDRRMGQMNMFAALAPAAADAAPAHALPDVAELPNTELLKFEKELLGFYISSHPLTEHQAAIERYSTASTREAMDLHEGAEVTIGGMIGQVRARIGKSGRSAGQKWAIIALEDLEGKIEGMVFAEAYARFADLIAPEQIVVIRAKVDRKRETPCLVITDVMPLEQATAKLTTALVLKLQSGRHAPDRLEALKPILGRHRGNVPVFFQVPHNGSQTALIRLGGDYGIRASAEVVGDVETILGPGAAELCGPGTRRQRRRAQQQLFNEGPDPAPGDANVPADELDLVDD